MAAGERRPSPRGRPTVLRRRRLGIPSGTLIVVSLAAAMWAPGTALGFAPPIPHSLPPGAVRAARDGLSRRWIVGADARRPERLDLRRFSARKVAGLSAYTVPTTRARALAAYLAHRHRLAFSEPDVAVRTAQSSGPGSLAQYNGWRSYLVAAGLHVPAAGPLLALVDTQAQVSHPAFAGSHISSDTNAPPSDEHGTATVAVAAAGDTGLGFEGIYPGARAENFASGLTCGGLSQKIVKAANAGAAVINMSFGSSQPCFLMYVALMYAVGRDALPVASAGNEFQSGNPVVYPASFPHILTIAAITPKLQPAFFSTRNLGVDVGAPGVGIVAPVPAQFDTHDGDRDGYAPVSGTSISAPMVAAMADWIRAVRPQLSGEQVAALIRGTAQDIYTRGYDSSTGYGLPQLAPALTRRAPLRPLLEPNDDVALVDGRIFARPAPAVWSGIGVRRISGLLDAVKNPADVFRIRIRPHQRFAVELSAAVGAGTVEVLSSHARSIRSRPIARARHVGRHSRRLTLLNGSSRTATAYVAVVHESLAALYRLTIRVAQH